MALGQVSNNAMLCHQRHLSNPTVHQPMILAPVSQAFLSFLFWAAMYGPQAPQGPYRAASVSSVPIFCRSNDIGCGEETKPDDDIYIRPTTPHYPITIFAYLRRKMKCFFKSSRCIPSVSSREVARSDGNRFPHLNVPRASSIASIQLCWALKPYW